MSGATSAASPYPAAPSPVAAAAAGAQPAAAKTPPAQDGASGATAIAAPALKRMPSSLREKERLAALAAEQAAKSIRASTVVKAAFGAWLALMVAYISTFRLWGRELVWGLGFGVLWGAGLATVYQYNRKRKHERRQLLAIIPGAKGMQELLHHIPTWISFRETEKMEWLNRVVTKVWPYYDEAVCKMVKEQVEPMLMKYKPPGLIKKIYFQKLTLGDDPFRVEGIRVDRSLTDEVCIEADFRWSGDANIFLAIELPAGGNATRMVPKVTNLAVSGTARVQLKPLLPEVPGFGAAVVSLMKPPIVRFNLDFGKGLGGSYSAGAIKAWLDPFLRETVVGMLLWPRRIVVPILPEDVTGPLDDLYLRHKGALQVDVVEARNLPRMDTIGTTDAFLEMWTIVDPKHAAVEKTKVVKNTLNPTWNERIWLMVQEPSTQALYVDCFDRDYINAKELLRLNVFKGASNLIGAKDFIGRCKVAINEMADNGGRPVDKWVPLGTGEFANEDGCGGGQGEVHLRLTYWPFELLSGHKEAKQGALIVTLMSCAHLAGADKLAIAAAVAAQAQQKASAILRQAGAPGAAGVPAHPPKGQQQQQLTGVLAAGSAASLVGGEASAAAAAAAAAPREELWPATPTSEIEPAPAAWGGGDGGDDDDTCQNLAPADLPIYSSDPFVVFKLNKETQQSDVVPKNLNPRWQDAKFDFFKVPTRSKLEIKVWDHDTFSSNELLGELEIDVYEEVQSAPEGDITKTWQLEKVPKDWLYGAASSAKTWLLGDDGVPKPSTITLRLQWIPFK